MLKTLIKKYNNPENFDTLSSLNYKLKIAEKKMAQNITQAMDNLDNLQVFWYF